MAVLEEGLETIPHCENEALEYVLSVCDDMMTVLNSGIGHNEECPKMQKDGQR